MTSLPLVLGIACRLAAAEALAYSQNFDDLKVGNVSPKESIGRSGRALRARLMTEAHSPEAPKTYAEVVDGIGPDGSRALRLTDLSQEAELHLLFRAPGPALRRGAVRFDLYFEQLPTVPCELGRRNFTLRIGRGGDVEDLGGCDPPAGGRRRAYLDPFTSFAVGKWYSLWIQYDAEAGGDDAGRFSVFVKPYDGMERFTRDHLVVENGTYEHNQHDTWGRLVYPSRGDRRCTSMWRIDNFALYGKTVKHVPVAEQKPAAFVDPAYVEVPEDASRDVFAGALDISRYVFRATAARLPVYRGEQQAWPQLPRGPRDANAPSIHVGATPVAQALVANALDDVRHEDAFVLKSNDRVLAVVGKTDLATRYGCYELLERVMGVRWYLPGEFGECVPQLMKLEVPRLDEVHQPAFSFRMGSGLQGCDFGGWQEWMQRMRLRRTIEYHHSLFRIFSPKKYGDKYPDLYPILRGKRYIPKPGQHGWQPCLTHPKAVEITLDYARRRFSANARSISLGINDGHGFCECERCMMLVNPSDRRTIRRSRWFLQYANQVARQVREEFPGKLIGYLGYGETLELPEDMDVEPNLVVFLVNKSLDLNPDGPIDVTRWQTDKPSWPRLDRWHGMIDLVASRYRQFGLYDWYFGGGRKAAPNLCWGAVQHYIQYAAKRNCIGVYVECYPNWGLDGHKYCFYFKQLWDPDFDYRRALKEFYIRFFGRAAAPMKRYFDLAEQLTFVDGAGPETLSTYTPEVVERCQAHLRDARRRAAKDMSRRRVRYFADAFGATKIMAARYHAAIAARKLMDAKAPLEKIVAALTGGCRPDHDFERYARWVLKGDRFQVKRPGSRHFAPMDAALRAFDEFVKTEVEQRAKTAKTDPALAAALLRREIAAKLPEPLKAAQVLARISP